MIPATLELERNWKTRALEQRPRLVLDRLPYHNAIAASDPLPGAYQTSLPSDLAVYLPRTVGQYPFGAFFVRIARALRAGEKNPELGLKPAELGESEADVAVSVANRARHGNYRIDLPAGEERVVGSYDRWCIYMLVVNEGATDAFLSFDGAADADGIPIAAGGGFYELVFGTVSEVRAIAIGGATNLRVNRGYRFPYPRG